MKKFVDWLSRNHAAVIFALAVLIVASIFTYFNLPKDVFPKGEFPRFQIIADIGFASLADTENNVTRPIEEAVKTVPDVLEVRSVTERGTSTIDIYLRWGADLNQAFQYVQSKLDQVRSLLPASVSLDVIRMNTSTFPISEYGVWSDLMDQKQLYSLIRYSVIPRLIGIDGVYGLRVIGGEEPEIRIKLNPQRMIQYNLNAPEIGTAIDSANKVTFLGNLTKNPAVFFATGGDKLIDVDSIGNTVIATRMNRPVYLKDVAHIEDSSKELRRIVSVRGHRGLFIDVQKQQNADSLNVSKRLAAKIAEIEKEFNGKLRITKWDLSDFVHDSIHAILLDIFIAILIILMIVYYVMNQFRYALPIVLVLPVVVILEFLVLKALGLTVNIMTLGGLSAAIGIIADNAIVITENYVRFKFHEKTDNPLAASMSAIVPITVWATLVSIIVFIPLNILSGVSGLFFRPLAVTLATTLVISLLAAVLIIPILIQYFVDRDPTVTVQEEERPVFLALKNIYRKILDGALRSKTLILGVTAGLVVLGILTFQKLPNGFLPEWDEGDIVLDFIAPSGNSIESTNEMAQQVETLLQKTPEVETYIRKTGTHMGTPFAAPTRGEIIILLRKNRKKSTFAVMDDLRDRVAKILPNLGTDFHQIIPDRLGDLTGVTKPIVVNLIGNDREKLWQAAQAVKEKLTQIPGLNGVLIDLPPQQKEIKVSANKEQASLLGVSLADIFNHAALALYGSEVSQLQRGLQIIPIRQFYEGHYRSDLDSITKIPIFTANGGILPLGKLASFTMVDQMPEVHHQNGSIAVSVTAEISGRALSSVVSDIKTALATVKSDNFTSSLAGSYKDQQTSFAELLWVLLFSIVLILAALLFIFESYRTSLAVFLGTLCSATIVILGLFLTHTEFDVSSFTGMITVMGIVVNNGILVIEFVERFRKKGLGLNQSIREAGDLRFRPVLITNLAAMAGFIPMALNLGHGGEVLRPFSIAMISGLFGSMIFSLIFMPVFYDILHQSKRHAS